MTVAQKGPFVGFPRGWFVVGFSDELKPGDIKSLKYFNETMMMYRGEDGVVRIMDSICPHLGADLAAGGKVIGDSVQCPFHHWRFGADGKCAEIPYCDKIPKKASLNARTVKELNGMIFLWYHPAGEAPDFEVPVLPNEQEEGWLPWAHSIIRIKTHSKEIVENVVDLAHFGPVHGTHVDRFDNEFTDHMAIQRTGGVAYPRGGGKDNFELDATYYGPGFQISDMRGYMHSMLVNAHTMIDENTLDLRFGVSIKPLPDKEATEQIRKMYVENLTVGFLEDVQIWENKAYLERPLLCVADGPIAKLRRWYAQFYHPEHFEVESVTRVS